MTIKKPYDDIFDYTMFFLIGDVFNTILEELKNDNKISMKFYQEIKNANSKDSFLFYDETKKDSANALDLQYYICCFSQSGDSLPMWNYYSKSGNFEGYNIEFHRGFLASERVRDRKILYNMSNVVYDRKEQEDVLRNILIKFNEFYLENVDIEYIKYVIKLLLSRLSLIFKNPCFEHEKETRIIVSLPKEETELFEIKYRVSNGCLIPYIECVFDQNDMQSITIGPLINQDLAEKTLRSFLKHNGYRHDLINKSKVPIRF